MSDEATIVINIRKMTPFCFALFSVNVRCSKNRPTIASDALLFRSRDDLYRAGDSSIYMLLDQKKDEWHLRLNTLQEAQALQWQRLCVI